MSCNTQAGSRGFARGRISRNLRARTLAFGSPLNGLLRSEGISRLRLPQSPIPNPLFDVIALVGRAFVVAVAELRENCGIDAEILQPHRAVGKHKIRSARMCAPKAAILG